MFEFERTSRNTQWCDKEISKTPLFAKGQRMADRHWCVFRNQAVSNLAGAVLDGFHVRQALEAVRGWVEHLHQ